MIRKCSARCEGRLPCYGYKAQERSTVVGSHREDARMVQYRIKRVIVQCIPLEVHRG